MKRVKIQLEKNSYEIIIEKDLLSRLSFFIAEIYKNKKIYISLLMIRLPNFIYKKLELY